MTHTARFARFTPDIPGSERSKNLSLFDQGSKRNEQKLDLQAKADVVGSYNSEMTCARIFKSRCASARLFFETFPKLAGCDFEMAIVSPFETSCEFGTLCAFVILYSFLFRRPCTSCLN